MTSFQNDLHLNQKMTCNDITELCLLGILFENTRRQTDLIDIVRSFDTGNWQPTRDVITIALERLIEAQGVIHQDIDGIQHFSITAAGSKRFFSLLQRPLICNTQFKNTFLVLKAAFLQTLPRMIQQKVVQDLIHHYHNQLNCMEIKCTNCPLNREHQDRQLRFQRHQIELELSWLNSCLIKPEYRA